MKPRPKRTRAWKRKREAELEEKLTRAALASIEGRRPERVVDMAELERIVRALEERLDLFRGEVRMVVTEEVERLRW